MNAIKVENLTKLYGKTFKAVDQVEFSINQGEVLALLGPNGAGKTTIFKMLVGLSKPTNGTIKIMGIDIKINEKEAKKKIGYSCQEIGLDPESTVLFNLKMFGRYQHVFGKKLKSRIEELSDIFEINDILLKKVKHLSVGIKKKVLNFSRLIKEPEILFLEEPTLGLDIEIRKKMWEHIEYLNKEKGMTIILTTHYLEEAERLCDKLVIIERGKIKLEGYIDELKKMYDNEVIKVSFSKYESSEIVKKVYSKLKNCSFVKNITLANNDILIYVEDGQAAFISINEILSNIEKSASCKIMISDTSLEDIYLKCTGNTL